jgi:hypothetical protein
MVAFHGLPMRRQLIECLEKNRVTLDASCNDTTFWKSSTASGKVPSAILTFPMAQPLTLIQLISEQTMQNVLPILALTAHHRCFRRQSGDPAICSSHKPYQSRRDLAAKQRLITTVPHFTPLNVINSDSPRIEEARKL